MASKPPRFSAPWHRLLSVYQNGAARRRGISIPLHLDRTAASNHRIGKYSVRLPGPASEGEMADPVVRAPNHDWRLQNYLKTFAIIDDYAPCARARCAL